MIALPQYIDAEAWDAFVEMRREIHKPLTVRGAVQILKRLQAIHDAGQDANDSLDQSSDMRWQTVYPVQALEIQKPAVSDYQRTKARLDAQTQRKASPPPPEIAERLNRLRRVA
jgi:hypothetical protein